MITLSDYFMGRREQYPLQCSTEIERNAVMIVGLANALMTQAETYGVRFQINPRTGSFVSSGWRPASINEQTPGAAVNSKHMTGQAVDLYDPDGELDDWLMTGEGQAALTAIGLWMENPGSTKGWCHVQSIPPRSGKRVFYP